MKEITHKESRTIMTEGLLGREMFNKLEFGGVWELEEGDSEAEAITHAEEIVETKFKMQTDKLRERAREMQDEMNKPAMSGSLTKKF